MRYSDFKLGDWVKANIPSDVYRTEGTGDIGFIVIEDGIINGLNQSIVEVFWTDTLTQTKIHPKYLQKLTKLEKLLLS